MIPVFFFFEDPIYIAERVGQQMGCSVPEAIERMKFFDQIAMLDFCPGNEIPKVLRN